MADQDKQFDPANPENKAITDGMERDGETLRDIREGKTLTEQATGVDLGTVPTAAELVEAEHNALLASVGEVVAAETQQVFSTDRFEEGFLETAFPQPSPEQIEFGHGDLSEPPAITALQAEHDSSFADVMAVVDREAQRTQSRVATPEQRQASVKARAEQRRVERQQRLQAKHGELFVGLGNVIRDDQPEEDDAPLDRAAIARLAHPGAEKPAAFGEAFGAFAAEEKQWRQAIVDLFKEIAGDIRQARLELDQVRGFLERSRL